MKLCGKSGWCSFTLQASTFCSNKEREREAMLLFLSVPAMVHGGIINKLNRAPRYYLLVIENNKIFIDASNNKDPDR